MLRLVALYLLLAGSAFIAPPTTEHRTHFEQRVWPVLRDSCLKCHGDARTRNGLDVSTRDDLLKGGEHGPAIVPGSPEKSLLIRAIRHEGDFHMPPLGKLRPEQISDLVEWIRRGAPWPAK